MEQTPTERLAQLVKSLRGNGSLASLGNKIGVAASTVQAWERAQTLPELPNLLKIGSLAGMSEQELMSYLHGDREVKDVSVDLMVSAISRFTLQEVAKINKAAATRIAELSLS